MIIGKSLSLVGASRSNTIIDATHLSNGIYIDGIDNPHLSHVVVTGFTIENANFEGILITNASFVTIWSNSVLNNDKSLNPSVPACPGIFSFETAEDFDCGEGIHLSGANHSTVANNIIEHNGGGILLSDDTGATHEPDYRQLGEEQPVRLRDHTRLSPPGHANRFKIASGCRSQHDRPQRVFD